MAGGKIVNLAGGAWVKLTASKLIDGGDPEKISDYADDKFDFALATGANYDEDFNVQPLEVLGHLGAVEYNSFGYTCSVNVDSLVAKDKLEFNKYIPNRADVQADGHLPNWLITFKSTDISAVIYSQFRGVVVAGSGQNIATNQFVSMNVRMMAIERLRLT